MEFCLSPETVNPRNFLKMKLKAIVEVAKGFGMKVAAHTHGDEGMKRAIRAGISSIEHGTYMSAETMKMMKDHGVYLVPTITQAKVSLIPLGYRITITPW